MSMSPEERADRLWYSLGEDGNAIDMIAAAIRSAETEARNEALEEAVIAVIKVQPPYEPPRALGSLFSERTAQAVEAIKALKSTALSKRPSGEPDPVLADLRSGEDATEGT